MDARFLDYLDYLGAVRGLSPKTVEVYKRDLAHYEVFLEGKDVDEADASDIRTFRGHPRDGKAGAGFRKPHTLGGSGFLTGTV